MFSLMCLSCPLNPKSRNNSFAFSALRDSESRCICSPLMFLELNETGNHLDRNTRVKKMIHGAFQSRKTCSPTKILAMFLTSHFPDV